MKTQSLPKLLLVDDQRETILEPYSLYLGKYFEVDTCERIDDAINKLTEYPYKVAVIDLSFPEDKRGGLKIIDYIKANSLDTKSIILTALGDEKMMELTYEGGIVDYIQKAEPATQEILLHSALNAIKLPSEMRIFLNEKSISFFNSLQSIVKLSRIEILSESLGLFNWAIKEWYKGREIGSKDTNKFYKIKNIYVKIKK